MNFDRSKIHEVVNMNGSKEDCKVVYYPVNETYKKGKLVKHKEPRVLIEVGVLDFREVPHFYVKEKIEIS